MRREACWVIGVLSVFRTEPMAFNDAEINLLTLFAEQGTLAIATSNLTATVEMQRAELARYLPKQVADLVSSPTRSALLEGHRAEITVVFADIRGVHRIRRLGRADGSRAVQHRCGAGPMRRWAASR